MCRDLTIESCIRSLGGKQTEAIRLSNHEKICSALETLVELRCLTMPFVERGMLCGVPLPLDR